MTDEEYRQQVNQRWKESMALLGLDDSGPDPEPPKPAPAPPPPAPMPERHRHETIQDKSPIMDELPSREPWPPPEEEFDAAEPSPVEVEMEAEPLGESDESLADDIPPAAMPEVESEDDKPDRRRRGRRGRRGKRTDEAEGEAPASEAESEDKDKEGAKRGRGRPRRRPVKTVEAESGDMDEAATQEAADAGDFGEDEPTDLSEFNVPSWQELIASLYRPER